MSEVGDIHPSPAIRPIRPKDPGAERKRIPESPERGKKHQPRPKADGDDDGEAHIDEYA